MIYEQKVKRDKLSAEFYSILLNVMFLLKAHPDEL